MRTYSGSGWNLIRILISLGCLRVDGMLKNVEAKSPPRWRECGGVVRVTMAKPLPGGTWALPRERVVYLVPFPFVFPFVGCSSKSSQIAASLATITGRSLTVRPSWRS